MSTVTIVIAGLALCNPDGSGAESLFFHPNTHELWMKVKMNGVPVLPHIQLGTQNTIQVSLDNAEAFRPTGAKSFDLIVDFDALHGRTLCLASPPMWTMSYFNVAAASLYTFKKDSKAYELWKKAGATRTRIEPNYEVGEKAGMSYNVRTDGSVVINVTNSAGITTPYPYPAGNDYEIEFDNTCEGTACGSDYPRYYEMLEQDNVCFEILLQAITGDDICNVGSGGRCNNSLAGFFQANNN